MGYGTINLANTAMILGMLYYGYTYGFHIGHFILIIWALAFWAHYGFSDERKSLLNAKISLLHAKAAYYDRQHRRDGE